MSSAIGTKTTRLYGTTSKSRLEPTRAQAIGDAGAGLELVELPDVGKPQDDEAHPQGHDQRVDPEDADADAGDQARQRRRGEGHRDPLADAARRVDERRGDEAGHRADGADREIDAARQHRQRLAAGDDGQRHARADDHADPGHVDDPGSASSMATTRSASRKTSGMIGRSRTTAPSFAAGRRAVRASAVTDGPAEAG